jgi:hypothetical protein
MNGKQKRREKLNDIHIGVDNFQERKTLVAASRQTGTTRL